MPPGDSARGRVLFESSGCLTCHRVGGVGAYTGPDLTDLRSRGRAYADLERALFDPDAQIAPENREVRLVLKDGATAVGRLLNRDAMSVQIMDRHSELRSFMKADLQSFHFLATSSMPSYKGKLSPKDAADIMNFLYSDANR